MSHQPKLHHVDVGGLALACHEWRAHLRGSAPTLWFVHATGFHGRVWAPVAAVALALGWAPVALDFRPEQPTVRMPGTTRVLDGVAVTPELGRELQGMAGHFRLT